MHVLPMLDYCWRALTVFDAGVDPPKHSDQSTYILCPLHRISQNSDSYLNVPANFSDLPISVLINPAVLLRINGLLFRHHSPFSHAHDLLLVLTYEQLSPTKRCSSGSFCPYGTGSRSYCSLSPLSVLSTASTISQPTPSHARA